MVLFLLSNVGYVVLVCCCKPKTDIANAESESRVGVQGLPAVEGEKCLLLPEETLLNVRSGPMQDHEQVGDC